MTEDESVKKKSRRGFAAMTKEKRQEIAAMGGRKAHALGVAHEFGPKSGLERGRRAKGKEEAAKSGSDSKESAA